MILSMSYQVKLFFLTVALGFAAGFMYDTLRVFRRVIKHNAIIANIEDILYWICVSLLVFFVMLNNNNGEIRLYSVVGALTGMILYFMSLSTYMLTVSMSIINFIKKVLLALFKIIIFPFKVIYIILRVPVIFLMEATKKIMEFIRKSLQKSKRYAKIRVSLIKNDIKIIFKKM